jgi:two-component system sensor histidine kinase RegB
VGGIVAARREGERLLRDAERRALNDEAVLRLGALAAGAAHELGTPLTTMGVVVGEMRREADTPERQRDVAILGAQIDACRRALANLRAAAGHACAVGGGRVAVDGFLAEVAARFCAMRPEVQLEARWEGTGPAPEIFADASLPQAILILLNNAADASSHHVDLHGRWDPDWLMIAVGDRGAGVPEGSLDKLGRVFFTTKRPGKGTGLGLVLAASTVTRLGGTIRWTNRADGGLFAELRLPLQGLTISRQTE